MYFVYVLRTNKDSLYTGQTKDLQKRLKQHVDGKGAKFLRKFDSLRLVYFEKVNSLSLALRREMEIKRLVKEKKEALVRQGVVPQDVLELSNLYSVELSIQHKKEVPIKQK